MSKQVFLKYSRGDLKPYKLVMHYIYAKSSCLKKKYREREFSTSYTKLNLKFNFL